MNIPITKHKFVKKNLVTIIKNGKIYDIYRCEVCGLEGKRHGFSDEIEVMRDNLNCTCNAIENENSKMIRIFGDYVCENFGFEKGKIYERCECPKEHVVKLKNDIWVYSEKRGEPVRILKGEFEFVKQ